MAYISYVRYLMATSKYRDAEILLKKLEILGEPAQRVESLIEIKILGATLCNILEEKGKAMEIIVQERDGLADEVTQEEIWPDNEMP